MIVINHDIAYVRSDWWSKWQAYSVYSLLSSYKDQQASRSLTTASSIDQYRQRPHHNGEDNNDRSKKFKTSTNHMNLVYTVL